MKIFSYVLKILEKVQLLLFCLLFSLSLLFLLSTTSHLHGSPFFLFSLWFSVQISRIRNLSSFHYENQIRPLLKMFHSLQKLSG